MPSEEVNALTRAEWRELGFFYDLDSAAKVWWIVGTRTGLLRFVHLLREYVANPARHALSEHDHYGPYMYLEIGTWTRPEINDHWIAGTVTDLARLADLAEQAVSGLSPGGTAEIGNSFAPDSGWRLELICRDEGFDPAAADTACW